MYVDGYYAGTVDDFDGLFQRLNVSAGRHEIMLKLEGYKTHRMKVYVPATARSKLHYDLEKGTARRSRTCPATHPSPSCGAIAKRRTGFRSAPRPTSRRR